MTATTTSDLTFEPKIWTDHIMAYFVRKLVYGAFAFNPADEYGEFIPYDVAESGLTINFPFFNKISDAEEPEENESLEPVPLTDGSFSASIFEIGKAVSFKKKAVKKSSAKRDRLYSEAQIQIARVMAEKVDAKLAAEMNTSGNYVAGYTSPAATDVMSVTNLIKGNVLAFGDRANEVEVAFMHSLQYLDYFSNAGTGFLKADSNDPYYHVNGFQGRDHAGMLIVAVDTVSQIANIGANKAFRALTHKPMAYGFIPAENIEFDYDKDALAREELIVATQWFAVKSFNQKVSLDDKRSAAHSVATSIVA